MSQKPTQEIIHLAGVIGGHLVDGTVSFSPAPSTGILSELAKFEARRIFTALVEEELREEHL
jgi:hypothetical protein